MRVDVCTCLTASSPGQPGYAGTIAAPRVTSVCRRRLRTAVASIALQSPRSSWCPGLGRLLASPALLCRAYCSRTWNRLPTALQSPELSLASFKRQLKTHLSVPALDSAGPILRNFIFRGAQFQKFMYDAGLMH